MAKRNKNKNNPAQQQQPPNNVEMAQETEAQDLNRKEKKNRKNK